MRGGDLRGGGAASCSDARETSEPDGHGGQAEHDREHTPGPEPGGIGVFTDERTETLGSGFASGAAALPEIPLRAACTFWMRLGRSFTATLLLLTCAATMSAVRVIRVSALWSFSFIFIVLTH